MQLPQETRALVGAIAQQQKAIMGIMDAVRVPGMDSTKDPLSALRFYMEGMREQCESVQRETFEMQVKRHRLKDRNTELEQQCNEVRLERKKMEEEFEQVKAQVGRLTELCAQLGIAAGATPVAHDRSPHAMTPHMYYSSQPTQTFFSHSASYELHQPPTIAAPLFVPPPLLTPAATTAPPNNEFPLHLDDLTTTSPPKTQQQQPSTPSGKPPRSPHRHEKGLSSGSISSNASYDSSVSDGGRWHTPNVPRFATPEPDSHPGASPMKKSVSTSDLCSPRGAYAQQQSPTRRATQPATMLWHHAQPDQLLSQQQQQQPAQSQQQHQQQHQQHQHQQPLLEPKSHTLQQPHSEHQHIPHYSHRTSPLPYQQQQLYHQYQQHRSMVSWPGIPVTFASGQQPGVAFLSTQGHGGHKSEDALPMFVAVPATMQALADGTAAVPFGLNLAMITHTGLGHSSCPGQVQLGPQPSTTPASVTAHPHPQFPSTPNHQQFASRHEMYTPRAAATR